MFARDGHEAFDALLIESQFERDFHGLIADAVEQSIQIGPINKTEIDALLFDLCEERFEIVFLGSGGIADVIGNPMLQEEIKDVLTVIHSARKQRAFFLAEIEQRNVAERNVVEVEVAAKIQARLDQLAQPMAKDAAAGDRSRQKAQRSQKTERGMIRIMNEVAPVAMF